MLIGIYTYDRFELCETVLENVVEFARYVGCSINVARVTISKAKHHLINYIVIDGRRKKIEFINSNDFE